MKDKLNKLAMALTAIMSQYDKILYVKDTRNKYLTDPVTAIADAKPDMGLDSDTLSYANVFANPVNVEIATEDCLGLINRDLIKLVTELKELETNLVTAINDVPKASSNLLDQLPDGKAINVLSNAVSQAVKYLPYAEQLNVRMRRNYKLLDTLNNYGIDHVEWVKTAHRALDAAIAEDTFRFPDPKVFNKLIDSDYKPATTDAAMIVINAETDPALEVTDPTKKTMSYIGENDIESGAIVIINSLVHAIINNTKLLESIKTPYVLSIGDKELTDLIAMVNDELKDPTSLLDKSINLINKYGGRVDRFGIVSRDVVMTEMPRYNYINMLAYVYNSINTLVLGNAD